MTLDLDKLEALAKAAKPKNGFVDGQAVVKYHLEALKAIPALIARVRELEAERDGARAAALKEAADHLLKHGWIGTTEQDIRALATIAHNTATQDKAAP